MSDFRITLITFLTWTISLVSTFLVFFFLFQNGSWCLPIFFRGHHKSRLWNHICQIYTYINLFYMNQQLSFILSGGHYQNTSPIYHLYLQLRRQRMRVREEDIRPKNSQKLNKWRRHLFLILHMFKFWSE